LGYDRVVAEDTTSSGMLRSIAGGHSSHSIIYAFEIASLYSLKFNLSVSDIFLKIFISTTTENCTCPLKRLIC